MTAEIFDRILELNAAGWSQTQIARETGRGGSVVNRVVRGLAVRPGVCSKCGGPMNPANATGICHSTPECIIASGHAMYLARTEGTARTKTCTVCGRPMKNSAQYGICNRKDNAECIKAHNAARYAAHPEHLKQQQQYRAIPANWCKQQVSYLRGHGLLIDLDVPYLLEQWGDGHCPVCHVEFSIGDKTSRAVSPSMDRVYKARGYRRGNVRIICMKCNRRKNDMSGAELMALAQDTLRAEAWADSFLTPTVS